MEANQAIECASLRVLDSGDQSAFIGSPTFLKSMAYRSRLETMQQKKSSVIAAFSDYVGRVKRNRFVLSPWYRPDAVLESEIGSAVSAGHHPSGTRIL